MIRYAGTEDISRIAEIIVFGKRAAYRPIFQDDFGSFNEIQVIKVIKQYEAAPELIRNILVYDDGIVKGTVRAVETPEDSRKEQIELTDFYVEPFFKGQGIGRKLIEYFCEEAGRKGKKKVYLWVLEENHAARRFYERNGFAAHEMRQMVEGTQVPLVYYDRYYDKGL